MVHCYFLHTIARTVLMILLAPTGCQIHRQQLGSFITFMSFLVFTMLHAMQMQSSDENSVRPSNVWIVTKWKKNQSTFLYHMKDHLA